MQYYSSRNKTPLKIALLGKTGVGKSSTGNTILGENRFISRKSLSSVTKECSDEESFVEGRRVTVVDTPGFFDTTLPEKDLEEEIAWSVFLSAPEVHAFLFVLPVGRFTKQEEEVLEKIQELFGKGVLNYLILLFTNGDDFELDTFESEVYQNNILGPVVERCQGRFHLFNNKALNNRDQVRHLLQMIDSMVEQNGGGHYSNEMMEEAQRFRREEEEKRQREEIRRRQREEHDGEESSGQRVSDTQGLLTGSANIQNSERRRGAAFQRFRERFRAFFRYLARKLRSRRQ